MSAKLAGITAPLVLISPDGNKQLIAACFPHPFGALYLDLNWFQSTPDKAAHLLRGTLSGDGPWKVEEHIIRVLGCQGTDPELQETWSNFQNSIVSAGQPYPPRSQITQIAKKLGASIDVE